MKVHPLELDLFLCAFILGHSLAPEGRDARERDMRNLKLTQKGMIEGSGAEMSPLWTQRVISEQLIGLELYQKRAGVQARKWKILGSVSSTRERFVKRNIWEMGGGVLMQDKFSTWRVPIKYLQHFSLLYCSPFSLPLPSPPTVIQGFTMTLKSDECYEW